MEFLRATRVRVDRYRLGTHLIFTIFGLAIFGLFPAWADYALYFYDPGGRLSVMVDPVNGSARYSYDANGNITAITRQPATSLLVAQMTPSRGAAGTTVVIAGTGFGNATNTSVSFNGVAAALTSVSSTQIVATVPNGATTGSVSVTSPAGTASAGNPFNITPSAPVISSTSPSQANPGDSFTVTGSGFDVGSGNTKVTVNGFYAQITAITATSITAVVPPVTSGHIVVTTPQGSASTPGGLAVRPPAYLTNTVDSVVTTSIGGSPTGTVNTAGDIGLILFDAQAGQAISVSVTTSAFSFNGLLALYGPDGVQIANSNLFTGAFIDKQTLNLTGTYTLVALPGNNQTGSLTANIYLVPPDVTGTIAANGNTVSLTTTAPGQNMGLTFTGNTGDRVSLVMSAFGSCDSPFSVVAPDGVNKVFYTNSCSGYDFTDLMVLPQTGTYTIYFDPAGTAVGTGAFTLYTVPPDISASITANGSALSLTTTKPSQNMNVTFSGTAGQRVSLEMAGFASCDTTLIINEPDGVTQLYNWTSCATNNFTNLLVLPTTGTYSIQYNPSGTSIGTATFTLYTVPADPSATISANGSPVSLTTNTPGQNMSLTFSANAGDRIGLETAPGTNNFSSCDSPLAIIEPDGVTQIYYSGNCTLGKFTGLIVVPVTGTYSISYNPSGDSTGTMSFTLYSVPPDATSTLVANGSPVSLTTSTPGQRMLLTFSGTVGEHIVIARGGVISPGFRALFLGCVGLADVSQPHCDAAA